MKRFGLGTICVNLLDRLYAEVQGPFSILETGTLRDKQMEAGWETEERSTLAIARWISNSPHPHTFRSVDSSVGNVAISKTVLLSAKLLKYVRYLEADSGTILRTLEDTFDFVLLDSDTDPRIIFKEFSIVEPKMERPSIILIDDVYKGAVNKGQLVLPEADRFRYHHWRIGETEAIALGTEAEEVVKNVAQELTENVVERT